MENSVQAALAGSWDRAGSDLLGGAAAGLGSWLWGLCWAAPLWEAVGVHVADGVAPWPLQSSWEAWALGPVLPSAGESGRLEPAGGAQAVLAHLSSSLVRRGTQDGGGCRPLSRRGLQPRGRMVPR